MGRRPAAKKLLDRRDFLKQIGYASPVLFPAPLRLAGRWQTPSTGAAGALRTDSFTDFRLTPAYPARSPLEEMLRLVAPGTDNYVTEKYAAEIALRFKSLRRLIQGGSLVGASEMAEFLHESV